MALPANPIVIPEAFAKLASGSFITSPIPDSTATPGAASWRLGFPPLTMTPEVGGGQPPFGQDFNGILFAISSHTVYAQQGLLYQFNAAVSALLGPGYAKGTLLLSSDGNTIWYSTVDANVTDPDGGSAAGWAPVYAYGIGTVPAVSGTVTLTKQQAAKEILEITGTLVGNVTIVVPTRVQQYLVVNATSGAFSVTVKYATGSGVVIPQTGLTAPSGIYGDGTNVYLTSITTAGLAPINSPTFTGTPAGPTPGTSDNTTRLATTAFVKANLALYALLASPTFTGTPRAPTPPPGDSSTRLATTAFINPGGGTMALNGTWVTPFVVAGRNLILKWGRTGSLPAISTSNAIVFPDAFPNNCFNVQLTPLNAGGTAQSQNAATNPTPTGFNAINAASVNTTFQYFAIGN